MLSTLIYVEVAKTVRPGVTDLPFPSITSAPSNTLIASK